jgi:hypothetical protein
MLASYIPYAFSIGRLHHGRQNLQAMEKIEAKYLQDLIDRSPIPFMKLRELINSIQAVKNEARECYICWSNCLHPHLNLQNFWELLMATIFFSCSIGLLTAILKTDIK